LQIHSCQFDWQEGMYTESGLNLKSLSKRNSEEKGGGR